MKKPAALPEAPPSWLGPAVFAAAFLAFLPALSNAFVDWDDVVFLVKNTAYQGLGPGSWAWAFTSRMGGHYHPLTWLSYSLDSAVWGVDPVGYHLTNVLLHGGAAWAFYAVARRLVSWRAAAAAALLFAVHPLRVESVAWASERRDVLSGLFYLLAVRDYIDGRRRRSLGFYAASLLSKAVGVTLPLALVLLDGFALGRGSSWRERLKDKAAYFALAAAAVLANGLTQSYNGALDGFAGYPLSHRLAASAYSLAFYLRKTLWPSDLVPIIEFPAGLDPAQSRFVLSALLAAGVTAAAVALRKRAPALLGAWGFYALTLLPTIGLVRFGPQLVADRYSYLSCLPFALLAGAGLERLFRRAPAVAALGGLLVLGGLTSTTWRQCRVWRDTDTFWTYVLIKRPETAIAHHNVGRRYDAQGRPGDALFHYERAVEIRPSYALAWNSLGLLRLRQGDDSGAEADFLKALEARPAYWEARANLGLLRARQGKLHQAAEDLRAALALEPERESLKRNLEAVESRRGPRKGQDESK